MANETIEILKLLISNKEETYSIRKISMVRKINYKSAYNAIKFLEKEKLATLKKIGNTTACVFSNKFDDLVFKAEYLRRKELFKNKDFLIIYNRLVELKFPFIALLFGSCAKGTAIKHSDVDLLLISNKEEAKIIENEINLIPLKIHLTAMNYKDFIQMSKSKEFSVVSEALKNNIILIGIEDYYRVMENVK